ncbi:hypothetical protein F5B19DRAFT_454591 [Rostrohypoxylon terebratum]|nr:hypothetical protein F5B19DRAFT_454591 [Rostrohypoxylon terebratum]
MSFIRYRNLPSFQSFRLLLLYLFGYHPIFHFFHLSSFSSISSLHPLNYHINDLDVSQSTTSVNPLGAAAPKGVVQCG